MENIFRVLRGKPKPFGWGLWFAILALIGAANVNAATFKEVQSAVRENDFARMQTFIAQDGGVGSDTAVLCLMLSAHEGRRELVEKCLAAGIAPNARPKHRPEAGDNALMYAAVAGRTEIVRLLLDRGADAKIVGRCLDFDCQGHTALMAAANCGSPEIIRMLLEAGADPNGHHGGIIELIDKRGDLPVFKLLLKHGGRNPAAKAATNAAPAQPPASLKALGLAELLPPQGAAPRAVQGRCRLAIVADNDNVAAADVLVAQLSAAPSVELIERQELEKVFAEQRLTRQFATAEANYGRVASLLRADALLLVRTRDIAGAKAVEARFIRVHPGIVLDTVYRPAPISDVAAWAEQMKHRVSALGEKAVRSDAIALSLLDVHSTLPSSATRMLERTLTILLRDRLVHDSRFIVLERAEMERIAFENGGEKPFWTGSYMVDPIVDAALNNSGAFTLEIQLKPVAGGAPIQAKVSGQKAEAGRAINELLHQVRSQLGGAAAPARDALVEARSYLEEAKWATAARMPGRAQANAEVAWALGLQTVEVARLRMDTAIAAARDCIRRKDEPNAPSPDEWLDFAIQATGVWWDAAQGAMFRGKPAQLAEWLRLAADLNAVTKESILHIGKASDQLRHEERLKALREIHWAALNDAWKLSAQCPPGSGVAEQISRLQAHTVRLLRREPAELLASLNELFSRHFATNDAATRAALRANVTWREYTIIISRPRSSGPMTVELPVDYAVKKQFTDSLRATGSPEDRFWAARIDLQGRYMSTIPEVVSLMETFWGMRDLFAANGDLFDVYYDYFHKPVEPEPFGEGKTIPRTYEVRLPATAGPAETLQIKQSEFRRRLYLYLLEHAKRPHASYEKLLGRFVKEYSAGQIAEVEAVRARHAARTGAKFAPLPVPNAADQQPQPVVVQMDGPKVSSRLPIKQFWHPFHLGRSIGSNFKLHGHTMLWKEDRLWVLGHAQDYNEPVIHHYLFSIEFPSLRTETIELEIGPPDGARYQAGSWYSAESSFVLTPKQVVFAVRDEFVGIYDRARTRWELYRDLKPSAAAAPLLQNGAVYFLVENGGAVVRLDLDTLGTRVLASTGRKPAASPLDDAKLSLSGMWQNDAGELVVLAMDTTRKLMPGERPLRVIGGRPDDAYFTAAWSPGNNQWRVTPGWVRSPTAPPGVDHAGSVVRANVGNSRAPGVAAMDAPPNATVLSQTWLELRLNERFGPARSVPVRLDIAAHANLPENRYGNQPIDILTSAPCLSIPQGFIIPTRGPGFWFLPREEFTAHVATMERSREMAKP